MEDEPLKTLRQGVLPLENFKINKTTELNHFEEKATTNNFFEVEKGENDKATVYFSRPVQLGSKHFNISISF
ncbi:hypothetical protein ACFFIX_16985 [Metabacillus herbersteinensis]|uniref:Uncharacterized protein n=1 Tax=Metabacillus herbersteinensis TaxID=283816 RepID=A0ABV6GJ11_9BACI